MSATQSRSGVSAEKLRSTRSGAARTRAFRVVARVPLRRPMSFKPARRINLVPRLPPTRVKITERAVEQLHGDGSEKFDWDGEIPGFGVRIRSSGSKYYVGQFRADGRTGRSRFGTG